MRIEKPLIVGLAGGSGSGKTTLAHILGRELPWKTTVIGFDQFYLDLSHMPVDDRTSFNFDHPDAVDVHLLATVLRDLRSGRSAQMPVYDFTVSNRTKETTPVDPAPVIVVEGIHALYHLPLMEWYDITIFLDIEDSVRFHRRLERDMRERDRPYEQVVDSWQRFARPAYNQYVAPSGQRAQLVFQESFAPQVVDVLTKTISRKMQLRENASGVMPL
jgi:uridine kinase